MIKGFKEFIAQGNALELAVAVIIGGAFKPIVDAITQVIMTIIGQLIGQPNFDSLGAFSLYENGSYTFHLATAEELIKNADGYVMPGTIITKVVNFFLIAVAVYFASVLPMNKVKERLAKQKAEEEAKEVTDVSCSPRSATCSRPTPLSSESRSDSITAITPSFQGPADPHDRRGLPHFPMTRRRKKPFPAYDMRFRDYQPQCGGISRLRRASLVAAPPVSGTSSPSPVPVSASCS